MYYKHNQRQTLELAQIHSIKRFGLMTVKDALILHSSMYAHRLYLLGDNTTFQGKINSNAS